MFTEFYREEKREEGDRCGQDDKGGNQKEKERKVQPVSSSLSVLHRLEHAKKFTELGREEKAEGENYSSSFINNSFIYSICMVILWRIINTLQTMYMQ